MWLWCEKGLWLFTNTFFQVEIQPWKVGGSSECLSLWKLGFPALCETKHNFLNQTKGRIIPKLPKHHQFDVRLVADVKWLVLLQGRPCMLPTPVGTLWAWMWHIGHRVKHWCMTRYNKNRLAGTIKAQSQLDSFSPSGLLWYHYSYHSHIYCWVQIRFSLLLFYKE